MIAAPSLEAPRGIPSRAARRSHAPTAPRTRCSNLGPWPLAGFSLIEVMIASIILVLAITTAITTLQRGLQAVDTARGYTYASQVMQSELERLRLKSWDQIVSLQGSSDNIVATPSVAGAPAGSFVCTRSITDLKVDMKQITLTCSWRGYDGRPHTARFITRYGKSGLYDYLYTSH